MALTEVTYKAEFLITEGNGYTSRDAGTLASAQNLTAGAVLFQDAVGGNWRKIVDADYNGYTFGTSQVGVLFASKTTSDNVNIVVITRNGEVDNSKLGWNTVSSGAHQTAVRGMFAQQGIAVRTNTVAG